MARIRTLVNYFAYGSNIDKKDLDKWCENHNSPLVNPTHITPARLDGYKLVFNYFSTSRNAGAANIIESPGDCTYGLLMELEERDRVIIRLKEGYPRYYGEICADVETFDGKLINDVITYKVVRDREKREHRPPTKCYLHLIIVNAKKYGFPEEYIEYLESIQPID